MIETDGTVETVYIRLPANPRYLRVARLVSAALANEIGADVDALDDVRLAVGEACGVAITAGTSAIDLRFDATSEGLVVSGEAPLPTIHLDPEDIRLTEQILRVATAGHELSLEPDRVVFTLRFQTGR